MMRSGNAFLHRALCRIAGIGAAALLLATLWWPCLATAQSSGQVALTAQELAWRQQHPVIRVGVYAGDHMPAESWVAGRPEGMAIDYTRLRAARVGLRLEFRPYTDWVAVTYVKPGQVVPYDLLTAVPIRGTVGPDVYLKPFTRAYPVLVARKGDLQIRTERDLPGARIAVDRNNRDLIVELQARLPDARLVFANSNREALDLLASRNADAYIGLSGANTRLLLQQRDQDDLSLLSTVSLRPRDLAPMLPSPDPMLLQLLRRAEASVTPTELEQLRQRWGLATSTMGASATTTLSKADRDWLRSQRPLRVGFEVDRPPYTFVNAEGRFDGLVADYIELIRKELDLQVQLVPAKDWNSLQRMARAREVDLVAAAMPEDFSAQDMVFSRPYEHFPEVIVTRLQGPAVAGPEDLRGRVVAAREEAGLLPRLAVLLPDSRIVPVGSNEAGLDLVADGKADAYIGTLPAIDALIRDRYAASLRISGPAGVDQDFTIGVSTDYQRLLPMIDLVLRNVSDEQRQRIRSRWLTADYQFGVPWAWVLAGLGIAALVLLMVGAAYSRSRKALEAKQIAENELAAQLAFQQALLETVPYPVFVKDTQGRYLAINQAYETMFGCRRDQLLGRDLTQTQHVQGQDIQALHLADLEVVRTGRGVVGSGSKAIRDNVIDVGGREITGVGYTTDAGAAINFGQAMAMFGDVRVQTVAAVESLRASLATGDALAGGTGSVAFGVGETSNDPSRMALRSAAKADAAEGAGFAVFSDPLAATDAVSIQQLADALGGGAKVDANGQYVGPAYVLHNADGTTTTVNNVGAVVQNLDSRTTQNTQDISNITHQINGAGVGLVKQDATSREIQVAANTGGKVVNVAGTGGNRTIAGVAAGKADNEAINVKQLKEAGVIDANGNAKAVATYDNANKTSMTLGGTGATAPVAVHNMAAGVADNDGVNVSQLNQRLERSNADARAYTDTRFDQTMGRIDSLEGALDDRFNVQDQRIDRMGAMNSAMSTMAASLAGLQAQNRVGVGVGTTNGEAALSVGYQRAVSDRANFTLGASATDDDHSVGAAFGLGW